MLHRSRRTSHPIFAGCLNLRDNAPMRCSQSSLWGRGNSQCIQTPVCGGGGPSHEPVHRPPQSLQVAPDHRPLHPQLLLPPTHLVLTILGNADTGKWFRSCPAVATPLILQIPLTIPMTRTETCCAAARERCAPVARFAAASELCVAAGGSRRMKMQWSARSQASSTLTRRWARAQRLKRAILCKCTTRAGSLTVQLPSSSDANIPTDADPGGSRPPQAPLSAYTLYRQLCTDEITDLCSPRELVLYAVILAELNCVMLAASPCGCCAS